MPTITTSETWEEFAAHCGHITCKTLGAGCSKDACPRIKRRVPVKRPEWTENTPEGFVAYLTEHDNFLTALLANTEWIKKQEAYYPRKDIRLSLQKAADTFWRTDAGWTWKRKSRAKRIDWMRTYVNSIGDYRNNVPKVQKGLI